MLTLPIQDWIHSREIIDADHVEPSPEAKASGGGTAGSKTPKVQWMPVPNGTNINTTCPICQEPFEVKWLDEAQEWVWTDAIMVGSRAYHASCHAEAAKDDPTYARITPEPVLGKRKAEVSLRRAKTGPGWDEKR